MYLKKTILRCLPVAILTIATAAYAQNQLGDGRGLDNSLQQGSGGRNSPLLQNTAGRYANALVTGNVAGLGGFHGNVGYGADYSFSGALPSDTVYNFNRISGVGNPAYAVPGSTGMLNSVINPLSGASNIVTRTSSGYSLGQISGQYNPYGPANSLANPNARYNSYGSEFAGSRNITYDQAQAYSSQPMAIGTDTNGRPMAINASPLTGMTIERSTMPTVPTTPLGQSPTATQPGMLPTTTATPTMPGESPEEPDSTSALPGRIGRLSYEGLRLPTGERLGQGMQQPQLVNAAAGAQAVNAFDNSLNKLLGSSTAKPGDDVYYDLLNRIRDQAKQNAAPNVEVAPDNRLVPAPTPTPQTGTGQSATPGSSDTTTKPENNGKDNTSGGTERPIDRIVKKLDYHLPPITTFAGSTQSLYNDAMAEAERYMRDQRYFDAQTAYARATTLQPDKPLAYVGLANANLGAGLIVPAAHELRALFNAHPELIAARYAEPILPPSKRLLDLIDKLNAYLKADTRGTEGLFDIAYIAYQTQDMPSLKTALDTWAQRDPSDPLLPLLRRIWLPSPPANTPGTVTPAPSDNH